MKTLLLLAFVAGTASADPVDNMVARCKSAMDQSICTVALHPGDYPAGATVPLVMSGKVIRVDAAQYFAIQGAGWTKNAQGEWLMCRAVLDACRRDFNGDGCLTARFRWKQTPP